MGAKAARLEDEEAVATGSQLPDGEQPDPRDVEVWNAWRRNGPNLVDLRGADLRSADLIGALASTETKWPTGFDPHSWGEGVRPFGR